MSDQTVGDRIVVATGMPEGLAEGNELHSRNNKSAATPHEDGFNTLVAGARVATDGGPPPQIAEVNTL